MIQHLLVPLPSAYKRRCKMSRGIIILPRSHSEIYIPIVLLFKIQLAIKSGTLPTPIDESYQLAIVECYLPDGEEEFEFDILDAGFFDDETVVVVYRLSDGDGQSERVFCRADFRLMQFQNKPV